jgi:tRNA G18 (ribose-2'-O)-methylase SpoU
VSTYPVDDPADPRISDYVGLTDVALRRRREPALGLFMAEGEKVIRRAVAAGYRVRSVLLEDKWVAGLRDLLDVLDAPVYVAGRPLLDAVTGYPVHRGALAAMDRRPLPPPDDVLRGARRVVVLEDIVSHTNVGAIIRSAAAMGVDAVLVSPRCADPLYRRSVKVSMGTVFQVPWTRVEPWPGGLQALADRGFVTAALALADDAVELDELARDLPERLALLLGTEGDGLSRASVTSADIVVRIPMAGGVDSLNVAAAAAVALWATRPSDPRRAGRQSRR